MISIEEVESAMRETKEIIRQREKRVANEEEKLKIKNEEIAKMLERHSNIKYLDDNLYNLIWKKA